MAVASDSVPHNPARVRARAIVGTTLVLVLVAAGYLIYHSFRNVASPPPLPGCKAGTGVQAIDLDPEQAEVAATIAGVAAFRLMPPLCQLWVSWR